MALYSVSAMLTISSTGVYFWDTFVLYQGSGNLFPGNGFKSSTRITENIVADIAITSWLSR